MEVQMAWVFFFFFNFVICIGVYPINNVVRVSSEQQRDSAMNLHVSILPQTPLPSRLPHSIEHSSMWKALFFNKAEELLPQRQQSIDAGTGVISLNEIKKKQQTNKNS